MLALVVSYAIKEHLEGRAVVQVFAGVQFERDIDAILIEDIQDRLPASRQFIKRVLDEAGRALGPRVKVRPCKRAREAGLRGQSKPAAGTGGKLKLCHRPLLARRRIAAHVGRGETVELNIVGGVNRDQLALQVG
jgi:hypothetical protein